MPGGIRLEIQAALGEDGAVLAEREGGRSPSIRRPRPPNLRLTTSRRPIFHHPLNLARSAPRTAAARTMSLDGADASTGRGILIGMLSAFASAAIVAVVCAVVYFFRYTRRGRILLDRIGAPGEFDDEQAFAREEAQALAQMDDLQRIEYSRAKAFVEANPPESMATDISLSQFLAIQEKGVSAWEFEPELEIANCFVEARTEIEFFDSACSVQSNLPVPKQNEVYYWEAKIYDKPDATLVSIGMATKPYPLFRLPGWHRHSVAYTSTGHRRYNQPFTATTYGPVILQGDVIGVGYRPRTGTVFFTRNGKKLDDVAHALRTQNLFPTVGANGPATVHVNFGQSGFVYIEANVKKWGLAPMTGSLAPPPPYGSEQGSILLEAAGRDGGAGEAGVAGVTNAWRSGHGHTGAGAGYGHGRSRSGPASSGPMPGSPGPVRSPTEISLAQLIHFADDVHDDVGEGTSRSGRPALPPPVAPAGRPHHDLRLDLGPGLGLGLDAPIPPPPDYSSPAASDRSDDHRDDGCSSAAGAGDHDDDRAPHPGMVVRLPDPPSPPVPSYEAATGHRGRQGRGQLDQHAHGGHGGPGDAGGTSSL